MHHLAQRMSSLRLFVLSIVLLSFMMDTVVALKEHFIPSFNLRLTNPSLSRSLYLSKSFCAPTTIYSSEGESDSQRISGLSKVKSLVKSSFSTRIVTKSLVTMIGFLIGDMIAQFFTKSSSLSRFMRMGLIGLLLYGPLGHKYYTSTTKKDSRKELKSFAVFRNIILEQITWVPFITCLVFLCNDVCIGKLPLAAFRNGKDVVQHLLRRRGLVYRVIVFNWIVRSTCHLLNFTYLRSYNRLLFFNLMQIFLNIYLSVQMHI